MSVPQTASEQLSAVEPEAPAKPTTAGKPRTAAAKPNASKTKAAATKAAKPTATAARKPAAKAKPATRAKPAAAKAAAAARPSGKATAPASSGKAASTTSKPPTTRASRAHRRPAPAWPQARPQGEETLRPIVPTPPLRSVPVAPPAAVTPPPTPAAPIAPAPVAEAAPTPPSAPAPAPPVQAAPAATASIGPDHEVFEVEWITPEPDPVPIDWIDPTVAAPAPIAHTPVAPAATAPVDYATVAPAPPTAPAPYAPAAPAPADYSPAAPAAPAPVAYAPAPPVAPVAPAPPVAPTPVYAAPVSIAGAEVIPAVLAPEPAERRIAPPLAPLPPRPEAPVAQAAAADPSSAAPPGFVPPTILMAESASLIALDPTDDPDVVAEYAPEAVPAPAIALQEDHHAPPAEIGGSAILGKIARLTPRSGDPRAFGRERGATVRIASSVLVVALLVAFVLPALAAPLGKLPIIGGAADQLSSLALYPKSYGIAWLAAALGAISIGGLIVVQMEKTAAKVGTREDAVHRLNVSLAWILTLTLSSGVLSLFKSFGWAAAGSATGFFIALCLLIPIGRLPGAQAMRIQASRAWALLTVLATIIFLLAPSFPMGLIALVAGIHVYRHWDSVKAGEDGHRDGPIDNTNRLSALLITLAVLIAGGIGLSAMTLSPDKIRTSTGDGLTFIPGAPKGPTITQP
jgi:hypothetical protein